MRKLFFQLLVCLLMLPVVVGAQGSPYTLVDALREYHDLSLLQKPADPPRRFGQLSSWDRNLANFDQGNFLREDPGREMVLMDVEGPGVLTRLWTAEPMGILRFYWDGAETPQIQILWKDLIEGKLPPLEEPFMSTAGGGATLRFPLPFEKGLKITLLGQTWPHWQIHYQYFPPGTPVESWWPAPTNPPPTGAPAEYTLAANIFEKPASAKVSAKDSARRQVALFPDAEPATIETDSAIMVTEVALDQASEGPVPEALLFVVEQPGRAPIRLPWRALCGTWESEADAPSLLMGRVGPRTYFRVPFVLDAGSRVSLEWAGEAAGEVIGTLEISYNDAPSGPLPRLTVVHEEQQVGVGARLSLPAIEGRGRLIHFANRVSAENNAYYMEGDELIYLEGEAFASIRGTGMEDLFDSAWYFMNGKFDTAVAALVVYENERLESGARGAWWPLGIPFASEARFELEGGALDDAPPTLARGTLIAQVFDEAVDVSPPVTGERRPSVGLPFGRRHPGEADAAGLPTAVESSPPVSAILEPRQVQLEPDETFDGMFRIEVANSEVEHIAVRLDLPFGWRGRLAGNGEEKEVFDIGWPPIEIANPEAKTHDFAFEVHPPQILGYGAWTVQLRLNARFSDGREWTIRHPVRITASPRGEPAISWSAADASRTDDGWQLDLPGGFEPKPGDVVSIIAKANGPDGWEYAIGHLEFEPAADVNNAEGIAEEILELLPEDGRVLGSVRLDGETHLISFPVGRYASWSGAPERLRFIHPEGDLRVEVLGAKLFRNSPEPAKEGWSRRVPYVEWPKGEFRMPTTKFVLEEKELWRSMRTVVSTPQDHIAPELRARKWLENVEDSPLLWQVSDHKYRSDWMPASYSLLFPARWGGERIAIYDERFIGERYFGIQFGFGPWCGRVGVRDCEGRLVAVQDLYMNVPSVFPQYTWFALPVPSRDGWIYLEALGTSPGSHESRIAVQKVMVFPSDEISH